MTTDKFIPAIEELGSALGAGEALDQALAEIAGEHGLAPQALRNRAERALGDLATYQERNTPRAAAAAEQARQERQWQLARSHIIHEAARTGEKLSEADIDARIKFLGVEWVLSREARGFQPTKATFNDTPRPAWIKE